MTAAEPSRTPSWARRLAPFVLAHRGDAAAALAGAALASAGAVGVPLAIRSIVDRITQADGNGQSVEGLGGLLAVLVACGVLRFVAAFLRRWFGGRLALAVQHDLRTAIYDHLQRLDMVRYDQLRTGQLLSRATSDVTLVHGVLAMAPLTLGSFMVVIATVVAMVVLSWPLALLTAATVPAVLVGALRLRRTLFPATWDAQQRAAEVAGVVDEAVEGVRVVKGFGQEAREVGRLATAAESLYASRIRAARIASRFEAALATVPALAQVGILALGGALAIQGRITLGTLLAFTTYLAQLAHPTRFAASALALASQARAGIDRIGNLLDTAPTITEAAHAVDLPAGPLGIAMTDVVFGYGDGDAVLDGLTLWVAPGEVLALVGASGSGKSTVAALVSRLYDADAGKLFVGGVDIRRLRIASLRAAVGMVFEDPFLFAGSVADNIAFGRPAASRPQIEAAAAAAGAHGFVAALPDGYDTLIGERGVMLSGGQRQRLALARALLYNPRILVLDDATSAVDAGVESEIHAALGDLLTGRTTLLVAHRQSTLALADRIAVMAQGRVVDVGTHDQLSRRCPEYRSLFGSPNVAKDMNYAAPEPIEATSDATTLAGSSVHSAESENPVSVIPGPRPRALASAGAGADAAAAAGWMPRAGRGSPFGHQSALSALAATPELLAALDALPPAHEKPGMSLEQAAEADSGFAVGRLLAPHRRVLLVALALVLGHAVAALAGPRLIRLGVDMGVTSGSNRAVLSAAGALAVVVLVDWWVSWGAGVATSRVAERILYGLRVRIFSHLQRLGLDYYERETAGGIMTRMTSDMEALTALLEEGVVQAASNLAICAGVVVAMVIMSPTLAGAGLAVVIPLVAATAWFRRRSDAAYVDARYRVAEVNAGLAESIAGVRVTKAFGREDVSRNEFNSVARRFLVARLQAQRLLALYFPFVELLSVLASVMVFGVGAQLVATDQLTIGELIAFSLYLTLFFGPVQQLSQVVDSYQQARASLRQMTALLGAKPSVTDNPDGLDPGRLAGAISFTDVAFRYPGTAADAVSGVNITIAPGETVALVGSSGAGKSTVLKLMARFADPTSGSVVVDGIALRDIRLSAFRRSLGYVPQEPFLPAAAVRDAIAYPRPEATDTEVEAAARSVGAHDMITTLPGGYHHDLAERGRSLAAGQRQLLALARARLADPSILLLDEATANLDVATEAAVIRATEALTSTRTTVLVAHRLTTARRADRIVVMDQGRVAETGTHDQLLANSGVYSRLWAAFDRDATIEAHSSLHDIPLRPI